MDSEKLPSSFDVVIIGTGLPESMIAASLARIGKSVLHIDRNDYYGAQWATFSFDSLLKWAKSYVEQENDKVLDMTKISGNSQILIPTFDSSVRNITIKSFIPEFNEFVDDDTENLQKCMKKDEEQTETVESHLEFDGDEPKQQQVGNEVTSLQQDQVEKQPTEVTSLSQEQVEEQPTVAKNADSGVKIDSSDPPKLYKPLNKTKQLSIVSQAKIKQKSDDISVEDFKILSRKFNLDTNPKFLFSAGPLVNAILKANISHYSEFQIVNRILTCKGKEIIEVPCNRSDIFSSKFLSMIEKRTLMKFLTLCLEFNSESPAEEMKENLEKPFIEFLQSRRLSDNLQKFIIYSIAMVKPNTRTVDGLKETCSFLKSLGRYGKSPFIWPLYGVGELPQAFCRMSAVFGSLYCLSRPASSLYIENNQCKKVVLGEEEIGCKYVVMCRSYLPDQYVSSDEGNLLEVSKAILITDGSILASDTETVSFLTIPPLKGQEELVRVIELGPAASACPNGLFVLYLTCITTENAISDLEDYAKLLTSTKEDNDSADKPKLLWSLYFNEFESNTDICELPENLFVTSMPGGSLGFGNAVENSEAIFKKICPEGEFLMTVPNAEDIVWDTEQSVEEKKGEQIESENKENSHTTDDSGLLKEEGSKKEKTDDCEQS